jgi:hypothetical protein
MYGFDPGNPYTQGFVKFQTGIRGYALRIPIILYFVDDRGEKE